MSLQTSDFEYELLLDRIAQTPAVPRESAKLMVVNRKTGELNHQHVADFPQYLKKGDVLVVNNTKVFHARLKSGNKELFLIRPIGNNLWSAIGRNLKPGTRIAFSKNFTAEIVEKQKNGTVTVSFNTPDVVDNANKYGQVPVPPYIKTIPKDSDYQTVYAKYTGSVAAPTAGFHLTKPLIQKIKEKGVTILEITLHVGLGTFMPIKSGSLDTHTMHSEWVEIKPDVAKSINQAKNERRRVIAVGTTTVRTLEGVATLNNGNVDAYSGDVNLFIQPGFQFNVVDALLTNFHLPKSTLIVLVSAFANRESILHAYKEAITHTYRFYSFGDAMFIE
jgi:S-adenosylmethionine:tRNA ribosyltransferase-isomerase